MPNQFLGGLPMGQMLSQLPMARMVQQAIPNTIAGQLLRQTPSLGPAGMLAGGLGLGQLADVFGGGRKKKKKTAKKGTTYTVEEVNAFLEDIKRMYGMGM